MIIKWLANKRYKIADRLINDELRDGNILDIGCGKNMGFLKQTMFDGKYGIDPALNNGFTAEKATPLYDSDFFDVITMLAVIEHLETSDIPTVLKHIYRILRPNGQFILTTPHPRSYFVLKLLKFDKGHIKLYNKLELIHLLGDAGFYTIGYGTFELGFNQWLCAEKGK